MHLDKLLDEHVVAGAVIGALIGLYFPLDAYKHLLVFLGVVMGIRLIAVKTK